MIVSPGHYMVSGIADRARSDRDVDNRALDDRDTARQDQRFQPRARQVRTPRRQHPVEPDRAFVAGDGDFQPPGAIAR